MKTIFSKVRLNGRQIAGLSFLILLSAIGQMLLPSLLAQMINGGVAVGSERMILDMAVVMAVITVFACLVNLASVRLASGIATDFAAGLRGAVFDRVQTFSAAEMDKFGTASLVTRSTSDITNVQSFLTLLLRIGLLAPMMAVAGLVFSSATGGKVSSVLLVAVPLLIAALALIVSWPPATRSGCAGSWTGSTTCFWNPWRACASSAPSTSSKRRVTGSTRPTPTMPAPRCWRDGSPAFCSRPSM